MTTIPLDKALDRATQGPLKASERAAIYCNDGYAIGWTESAADAALLAHCRNTLPGLVEAVEALVEHSESKRRDSNNDLVRQKWALDNIVASELVKNALREAQNVRVP